MKEKMMGVVIVLWALLFMPIYTSALTLNVADNGQLMGASGVEVLGNFYDVEFVDGSCNSLFSGCTDFTFSDAHAADLASYALLDQVLLDGPHGYFDSDVQLTNGLELSHVGAILTPYAGTVYSYYYWGRLYTEYRAHIGIAYNYSDLAGEDYVVPGASDNWWHASQDSGVVGWRTAELAVWARWTAASSPSVPIPTPEPGTLLLLSSGLASLGVIRRTLKVR